MFAVKSTYSIKTPDGKDIPFYVADNSIFFNRGDLQVSDINTELFPDYYFVNFENYKGEFISLVNLKEAISLNSPRCFYQNNDFWIHFVYHNDTKKVIAEVNDAQTFIQDELHFTLPEEWGRFNPRNLVFDTLLTNLHEKPTPWIEKFSSSLRILATNDKQRKTARRVYDEAWKILKEREKTADAGKRPTVHDTLAKFGLTDDDLIHAALNVHENKFASEQAKRQSKFNRSHAELKGELRRILK